MRKIILGLAVSLDGFIEGPNGEYDWCFNDQDYGLTEFSRQIDTLIMGRKTYEVAQTYEGPSPWSESTTYVFSRTLKSSKPRVVIVAGNLVEWVQELKSKPGKDIWLFGGADLISQFANQHLIDEYWLSVHPILLGKGKPLFHNLEQRKNLKLVNSKVYDTGLMSVWYQPLDQKS